MTTMTPKATKLIDDLLNTHAARVGAKTRAAQITTAGDANAAHAALAEYIEGLEQALPMALKSKSLRNRILDRLDKGPARLSDIAADAGTTMSKVGHELATLKDLGRIVRLSQGVWGLEGHSMQTLPPESVVKRRAVGEIECVVMAFLKSIRGDVQTRAILERARERWPDIQRMGLSNALASLEAQGLVQRVRRGVWRARTETTEYAP